MSNLLLADDLFPLVVAKAQINTIRSGHRDIPLGHMLFEATNKTWPPLVINVTEVKHCALRDLTVEDMLGQGVPTTAETLNAKLLWFLGEMQRFYPEMTMDSPVSVIEFDFLRIQGE